MKLILLYLTLTLSSYANNSCHEKGDWQEKNDPGVFECPEGCHSVSTSKWVEKNGKKENVYVYRCVTITGYQKSSTPSENQKASK